MSKKLLIVDDEYSYASGVIERLVLEGFKRDEILYCGQIDEALSALAAEKEIKGVSLDLLIGDNMNIFNKKEKRFKINGLNALAKIRTMYPYLPIVCLSILGEQEGNIREAMIEFNCEFISKSVADDMEKLAAFFKRNYGK